MENIELTLKGKFDDLLSISNDETFKMTRLFQFYSNEKPDDENISIDFVSCSQSQNHSTFDKFLGKEIEITIRALS